MKYYQVLPEYDNQVINPQYDFLVGNELYTEREYQKLKRKSFIPEKTFEKCFKIVDVPKNQSYFLFGARFNVLTGGCTHE